MITLFRMIRCLQLKTKWKLAVWQLIDKNAMKLVKNPKEFEEKMVDSLVKQIHESDSKSEN